MTVVKNNDNLKYISIATDMNEHDLSTQVPSCLSIADNFLFAQVFDVFDQELLDYVIEAVFVLEVQVMLAIWEQDEAGIFDIFVQIFGMLRSNHGVLVSVNDESWTFDFWQKFAANIFVGT